MPIIKSAKKRVRVARKATVRNSKTRRSLKDAVKAFHKALGSDKKNTSTSHAAAQSAIGKAAKKHVMHKNKAARKQRQLAKAAKDAGISVSSSSKRTTSTTKPAATKKASAKKNTAKKTSAKK